MNEISSNVVTAGLLVIGDEILSGRTKDKNIGYIAEYLTNIGVDLKEVRAVSDDEGALAKQHPDVSIGSYPFFDEARGPNTNVVVRARDRDKLAAATAAVTDMLKQVRGALAP